MRFAELTIEPTEHGAALYLDDFRLRGVRNYMLVGGKAGQATLHLELLVSPIRLRGGIRAPDLKTENLGDHSSLKSLEIAPAVTPSATDEMADNE